MTAESKGTVEALFTWTTRKLEHRLPGTTKATAKDRGAYNSAGEAAKAGITLDVLEKLFIQAIVDGYMQEWDKLRRAKRSALWEDAVKETGVPRWMGSPDDLKLLLMKAINRKNPATGRYAIRSGTLSFLGHSYTSPGLLDRLRGREIDIYYDRRDISVIYLFLAGEVVGEAYCTEYLHRRVSIWEAQAERHADTVQAKAATAVSLSHRQRIRAAKRQPDVVSILWRPNGSKNNDRWICNVQRFIPHLSKRRCRRMLGNRLLLAHHALKQQPCCLLPCLKTIHQESQPSLCQYENGGALMANPPSEEHHAPFIVCDDFLETAFERRFQGLLRHAWKARSWHIIAAIPGSGKSWGIGDLMLHSGACKEATGATCLPLLAIRAPTNSAQELALATALAAAFGMVPRMTGAALRLWLVQEMARDGVECMIIDDAQELTLEHLALLKELTDNLAAPPYQRHVGLCLVAAISGNVVPFREVLAGPEIRWRQFRRRMDTEHPYHIVPGHTEEEVSDILTTFEQLYRNQLPDIRLGRWTRTIFTWLTNPILDPDGTGRVTMDHLTRLVTTALRRAYLQGASDIDATTLQEVADLMILRRDEITVIDGLPPDESGPVQEVG